MKRIVTICLVALLLSTNYAYATLSVKELSPTIEAALNEKQLHQQIEELFAEIIVSIMEGEGVEGLSLKELSTGKLESVAINPNQEFTGNPITDIILLLVYGVSYILQLALAAVNGIVYAVTWIIQVLVSIFSNFPEVLVNFISFIVNLILGVVEIILGASSNLLYYLIPLILTVIIYIIDIDDIFDDIDLVT